MPNKTVKGVKMKESLKFLSKKKITDLVANVAKKQTEDFCLFSIT